MLGKPALQYFGKLSRYLYKNGEPINIWVYSRNSSFSVIPKNGLLSPKITQRFYQNSSIQYQKDKNIYEPKENLEEKELSEGFLDESRLEIPEAGHNWEKSFFGLSSQPFSKEICDLLTAPLEVDDIEIKPDGILYLPEIKYRRILNKAFGPGGWGLAPRGNTNVTSKSVSREYALVCHGRLVSVARGEQTYFDPEGIATASEGCKSNALMRCCKDLGVASELWDPRYIRVFKRENCVEVFVENVLTKKRRKLWRRKEDKFSYPYKEV
ncbi:hypothetical protein POMI540_1533 [Schizosaccharomyces pombe]